MLPETEDIIVSVSDFVALLNQSLDYAFPSITIEGELANLRVSKGKWLYFDLKDETATVKFFGTVYHLPGPLEDGMLLKVRGVPHLHNLYGFSVNVQTIQPSGEGAIRRAADLLRASLAAEGLFDASRKRLLPYPPERIGLITSAQSAAYADFIKILSARWRGISIELVDVQVQGDPAVLQIVDAIKQLNALAEPPEVIVIIRGGGSAEDLAAFSTEQVTRAVAASRVPTLVAIGHEIDISLAELAADARASTPSNAAELLVPDRRQMAHQLDQLEEQLLAIIRSHITAGLRSLQLAETTCSSQIKHVIATAHQWLANSTQLLAAYDPEAILRRGYAIVRLGSKSIRQGNQLGVGAIVQVQLSDADFVATVKTITPRRSKSRSE